MAKRAGYSGTPLAKKLGIVAGKEQRVLLVDAPRGFEGTLEGLPGDARVSRRAVGAACPDVIVAFVKDARAAKGVFAAWAGRICGAEMLWVCWPKGSSGLKTDVNENVVRELGLSAGLVDNKVCAVDETWSGLRLVRRVQDRRA